MNKYYNGLQVDHLELKSDLPFKRECLMKVIIGIQKCHRFCFKFLLVFTSKD